MTKYATFGDIEFCLPSTGIEVIESESGQHLATYELATGKPLVVPVGEQLRKVTLKIKLKNTFAETGIVFDTDIKDFITKIDEMVSSGEAQDLILSSGVYQGAYFIEKVKSKIIKTNPNGVITDLETDLELVESIKREDTIIIVERRKRTNKAVIKEKKSIYIFEEREKKEYAHLWKSIKLVNPLYAAYSYGKRVLL